jgi:dGTP triphosphohydrolase
MYVFEHIRFLYLFIVDARRVACVAELVADVAELVPDVEDAACAELLVAESLAELGMARTVGVRNWAESRTGGSAQEEALVTISASDGMI